MLSVPVRLPLRPTSVGVAVVLVLVLVAGAACRGAGDVAVEPPGPTADPIDVSTSTSTESSSTSSSSTTTITTTTVPPGDVELSVEPATIWMAAPSGVAADRICSPVEPVVAVLDVPPVLTADRARARVIAPDGRAQPLDLVETDDGGWRALIGPLPARRSSSDLQLTVEVEVELADGERTMGRTELEALAPVPCGAGERPPSRTVPAPGIEVRVEPGDGLFVAAGLADCAARPTSVGLQARTRGNIVAVEASVRLPDGRTIQRSLRGGPRQWRLAVGDVGGRPDMPETSIVPVTVVATDASGSVVTSSVVLTLAKPVPCDDATTIPGTPSTTVAGAVPLRVRVTASSTELYARVTGGCPPGPTDVVITAETTGAVRSAVVESRTGAGDTAIWTMRESSSGRWTTTVGPFTGVPNMPATSNLGVRLTVTGADGSVLVEEARLTLRRPPRCEGSTTSVPGNPPAPTTTTTPAPATTTTSTTTSPTTTQPPTTSEPLSIEVQAPQPGSIDAQIAGACPTRPLTFQVSARTTGPVSNVGVQVTIGQVTLNQAMSGGSGSWSVTLGPVPGQPGMPESVPISIRVIAGGSGGQVERTTSATLRRPPPCP